MLSFFRFAVLVSVVGWGQARAAELTTSQLARDISNEPLLTPGSPAVWQDWDGSDWEIFGSDGRVTTQLTDNEFDDSFPQRSGSNVVWQGWDGSDWEVFQFNGNIAIRLTDNNLDDIFAHFSGSNVKWQGWDGNDWEIFQFDGTMTTQLTDNSFDDRVLFAYDLDAGPTGDYANNGESLGGTTPEPSALALAGLGLIGLFAYGWRRPRWA